MVVVILGVLSALAVPRFADLSGSSRVASLRSIAGSMKSIVAIVHMNGVLNNIPDTGADAQRAVPTSFGIVDAWYKYPETVGEQGVGLGIVQLISLDAEDIQVFSENTSDPNCYSIRVGYNESTCYVQYKEACSATEPPEIDTVITNC